MKTAIFWFSGTGNSLHVAKRLAAKLHGETHLVPFHSTVAFQPLEVDRAGLVFPVYGWGPPNLVASRIRQGLPLVDDCDLFTAVTCGASAGGTIDITRRLLAGRGRGLRGGYVVKMPENYPPMGGAPAEDKQREINASADEEIGRIAASLNADDWQMHRASLPGRLLSRLVNRLASGHWPKADRKFRVDESCTSCGRCEQICPVGDIELVEGRPVWRGHCEQCFACLHWCPERAIQFGRKSAEQSRYHHPGVSWREIAPACKEA